MPKLEEGDGKNKNRKSIKYKKREEIKAYVYFTHRQLSFGKNTKRTRTVESGEKMAAFPGPRPPDIQICMLASDGIGWAIIRICSNFGTSI